jgi:hypothetical protein
MRRKTVHLEAVYERCLWAALAARSGCRDRRQLDDGTIAHGCDGFQAHVACTLHRPFVVLLEQHSADEADDGVRVGVYPGHIAASLDLTVEPLDRVCVVQLGRVLSQEVHVGQHVSLGVIHRGRKFQHPLWLPKTPLAAESLMIFRGFV